MKIAMALADAFKAGVNDLPLSMVLSLYEQKAVVTLLSLLYLGVRDIRLCPSLPAFVTPAVLDVLVKNFDIMPITTLEQDLNAILGSFLTPKAFQAPSLFVKQPLSGLQRFLYLAILTEKFAHTDFPKGNYK